MILTIVAAGVLVITTVIFLFYVGNTVQPTPTHYDDATVALERKQQWTIWLTGLQTAAITGMGIVSREHEMNDYVKSAASLGCLFFSFSIVLSTWLLSGIPSVQQRLTHSDMPVVENDIYAIRLFTITKPTLGRFSGVIHTYFVLGMIAFVVSTLMTL